MSFREIIDIELYEKIVEQFISELKSAGIKPSNQYVVVKLPVQSFQGFFSSIPLIDALNKYGLRANLKTVRIPEEPEEDEKTAVKMKDRGGVYEDPLYQKYAERFGSDIISHVRDLGGGGTAAEAMVSTMFGGGKKGPDVDISSDRIYTLLEFVWKLLDKYNEVRAGGKYDYEYERKFGKIVDLINTFFEEKNERPFETFVRPPDIILDFDGAQFVSIRGAPKIILKVDDADSWVTLSSVEEDLENVCFEIIKTGFNHPRGGNTLLILPNIPPEKRRKKPKEDYLQAYVQAFKYEDIAYKKGRIASILMLNAKEHPNDVADELWSTLQAFWGIELSKNVPDSPFKRYRMFSGEAGMRYKAGDVSLPHAILMFKGEGSFGKDIFGETIGYPTPNLKTKWTSALQLLSKLDWYPQKEHDERDPLIKLGLQEILPISTFLRVCGIDYKVMRQKNQRVRDILNKAEKIKVIGQPIDGIATNLIVSLGRRTLRTSDSEAIWPGLFANFPGGEVYLTPESVDGTFVVDETIAIDQSYPLESPLIIKIENGRYTGITGNQQILNILLNEKEKVQQRLTHLEGKQALPNEVLQLYKDNIDRIGELGIGTNPNAQLPSNYLIEAEKADRTIHLALGSGYEPDRATLYHWDAVAGYNQKLTLTALTSDGKETSILIEGDWSKELEEEET
ncbi:MAG: hypothetical protein ACFFCD_13430 [Promethearchaeota archaeon]